MGPEDCEDVRFRGQSGWIRHRGGDGRRRAFTHFDASIVRSGRLPTPREALVRALGEAVAAATAAGDLEAARVAVRALGELLGTAGRAMSDGCTASER
jgi:hypothetical protein